MNKLINEELLEATYGFCLKHLGNPDDAQDLTQEIFCQALMSKDREIENFYGWFWKMAKNRINRFYRIKQNCAVLLDEYINVPSESPSLDSELLKEEEINELNYHISRLSDLHRKVIIMYYLREMPISDIAKELDVAEGTVKRRLFDARNDIKKGMENMTKYGRASYAPAEVNLWGAYGIPNYWNKIDGIMERQIFACCAFEAKTVKEIADEIGCAPVYFEDKLLGLVNDKFIKETSKGRYITDFCLVPEQIHNECNHEIALVYKDLGREMTELIKANENRLRKIDFYGNKMPFGELLWFFFYIFADALQRNMSSLNESLWKGKVPEDNGKTWRLAGTIRMPDENIIKRETGVPCVMWSNFHKSFMTKQYKWVQCGNIFECSPFGERNDILNEATADLFMRIFDDANLDLTENEKFMAANLIKSGYLKENQGGLYPAMPIMSWDVYGELINTAVKLTSDLAKKYHDKINEISNRILLPAVRKDLLEEYAHWLLLGNFFTIGYLYGYAMNDKASGLKLPEDYNNTALAIYITYTK